MLFLHSKHLQKAVQFFSEMKLVDFSLNFKYFDFE